MTLKRERGRERERERERERREREREREREKVRLMKPIHDSLLLRVSCLRTHQTVFNKENSYHLVYIQACEKLLLFA